jgi:hypothetical protein
VAEPLFLNCIEDFEKHLEFGIGIASYYIRVTTGLQSKVACFKRRTIHSVSLEEKKLLKTCQNV